MKSMTTTDQALQIVKILRKVTKNLPPTASQAIVSAYGRDPYLVLISCLLSLRTRDTISLPASIRLFEHAKTPAQMLKIPVQTIEKLIFPTGFYRRKARQIHDISRDLIARFEGTVPDSYEQLMSLKGVGGKTANLVLGMGFGIPAICVDVHVHRISNRLGLIKTRTPEETEAALKKIIPKEYWIEWNNLLVMWGQNVCVPVAPFCSKCAIYDLCERVGVTKRR